MADEAFALHEHLMRPFPVRVLTKKWHIFNNHLSRARPIVENAFGILSNCFRIFHTAINLKVENIDWVVIAYCALHNLLQKKATQQRTFGTAAVEDPLRPKEVSPFPSVVEPAVPQQGSALAKQVREEYMAYFNGKGAGRRRTSEFTALSSRENASSSSSCARGSFSAIMLEDWRTGSCSKVNRSRS